MQLGIIGIAARPLFILLLASALCFMPSMTRAAEGAPYNAEGERVGEVTDHSAVIHTRLTAFPTRNEHGYVFPVVPHGGGKPKAEWPEGKTVADLEGACPGKAGKVRVWYGTDPKLVKAQATAWAQAVAASDFTHQFKLDNLRANTVYYYAVEMAAATGTATRKGAIGQFRTAPRANDWDKVKFTVITGQDYRCHDIPEGYRAYKAMKAMGADFLVSTGDSVYYDTEAPLVTSVAIARFHWQRIYSLPTVVDFFRSASGYWEKDDHDTFEDDDWPTREPQRVNPMTYNSLVPVFSEQVPIGRTPYRSFRWGKGLEIWLVEGRDFRSPNSDPDGPEKTIWGKEQKQWVKRSIEASDAQYRVLISPTPIVGPDNGREYFKFPSGGGDNAADASFQTEGREIREWSRKLKNFYEICGDRHWQYHSICPKTGMHEFSCGPVTDTHVEKPFPEDPRYHRFLRFKGGFLSVSLEGTQARPLLAFRFHDVDGKVLYEYVAGK